MNGGTGWEGERETKKEEKKDIERKRRGKCQKLRNKKQEAK